METKKLLDINIDDAIYFMHTLKLFEGINRNLYLNFRKTGVYCRISSKEPAKIKTKNYKLENTDVLFNVYIKTANIAEYILTEDYSINLDIAGVLKKFGNIKIKDNLRLFTKEEDSLLHYSISDLGDQTLNMHISTQRPLELRKLKNKRKNPNFTITLSNFALLCKKLSEYSSGSDLMVELYPKGIKFVVFTYATKESGSFPYGFIEGDPIKFKCNNNLFKFLSSHIEKMCMVKSVVKMYLEERKDENTSVLMFNFIIGCNWMMDVYLNQSD